MYTHGKYTSGHKTTCPVWGSEIKVMFMMNLLTLLGHEHHQLFGVRYLFLFFCITLKKALFRKTNDPCYLSVFPAPMLSYLFLSRSHVYFQAYTPLPGDHDRLETSW